jgi:predicted AlkP superfamily phosphohydrolase/phosphomutase
MSDHGFNAFRRQVHLNSWLRERGYVVRREGLAAGNGQPGEDPLWLAGVDMQKTVAFGFGLAGLHLNRKSFFAGGILSDAQAAKVKAGLIRELEELTDPATGARPIARAQDAAEIYHDSPYGDAAPDIIVGWRPGYRVSWESAKGQTLGPVFSDNPRHWSGDHCFYPPMVPGVLLSTLQLNGAAPRIVDIAPTVLQLLGVEPPAFMDGRSLLGDGAVRGQAGGGGADMNGGAGAKNDSNSAPRHEAPPEVVTTNVG